MPDVPESDVVIQDLANDFASLNLPVDTQRLLLNDVCSLIIAARAGTKAVHSLLKQHGVNPLGLRAKVAMVFEALCRNDATRQGRFAFRLALEAEQIGAAARTVYEDLDSLLLLIGSPRDLHNALRRHGINALGMRQKVILAMRPLAPKTSEASFTTASHAESNASDSEDGPVMEENLMRKDESEEEGLLLEDNGADEARSSDGESSVDLTLEENADVPFVGDANELIQPPTLTVTLMAPEGVEATDPIEGALLAGMRGSKPLVRATVVSELLALDASVAGTQVDKQKKQRELDLCSLLHHGFTSKMLTDLRWRSKITAAAAAAGASVSQPVVSFDKANNSSFVGYLGASLSLETMLDTLNPLTKRVAVLGLGSGVPALVAAKAGAEVVWAERCSCLADQCSQLSERNRLTGNIRVLRARSWGEMDWETSHVPAQGLLSTLADSNAHQRNNADPCRFDAVITEEISDDLLSDGLLSMARLARQRLLRPCGTFLPRKSVAYAALASVRTKDVCGFDSRLFNVFRNADTPVYDFEEVLLNEPGCGVLLSQPILLFAIDLNAPPDEPPPPIDSLVATVSEDGVFNCVVTWFDLDFGDEAGVLSFAPNLSSPSHMYFRSIKNRLRFVGYERRVLKGEQVQLSLSRSESTFEVYASADPDALQRRLLVHWPAAPLLSYHFPSKARLRSIAKFFPCVTCKLCLQAHPVNLPPVCITVIAETARNARFERALLKAIREYRAQNNGQGPHVLDIGTGTGLLAMMAARGGARKVTSVEMVPVICEVAEQIVDRNNYSDIITVINKRSDELSLYAMGGEKADILVSELVDDHVIGDGILNSISDARKRLLTPEALIVPRAGRMFALPISLRTQGPSGIELDDLNSIRASQLVLSHPYYHTKLQRLADSEYSILGPPVQLFDFDWAGEVPGTLAQGRVSPTLPLHITNTGVLNGLLLYFTLQMDAHEGMPLDDDDEQYEEYSSGFDNPETHWDQPVRFLPVELHMRAGQKLSVVAEHNLHDLHHITISGAKREMLGIGLRHLIGSEIGERLSVTIQVE